MYNPGYCLVTDRRSSLFLPQRILLEIEMTNDHVTGRIIMSKRPPAIFSPSSSPIAWLLTHASCLIAFTFTFGCQNHHCCGCIEGLIVVRGDTKSINHGACPSRGCPSGHRKYDRVCLLVRAVLCAYGRPW